jgi:hypothetical protein
MDFKIYIEHLISSTNYAKTCLFTSWQIAQAGHFKEFYKSHKIDYSNVLKLEQNSQFYKHIVFTNWRMFAIEIDKIIREDSIKGILKLFNRLENKNEGFNNGFDLIKIRRLREEYELKLNALSHVTMSIRIMRDKYYAHRDGEFYIKHQGEVKFSEGEKLLNLIEEIISKILLVLDQPEPHFFKQEKELVAHTGVNEMKKSFATL